MKVLIAGASGLIGSEIRRQLSATAHDVAVLSRSPVAPAEAMTQPHPSGTTHAAPRTWRWQPERGILPAEAIEWADAVISLNGTSIARLPWTRSRREGILESRVQSTSTIAEAIRTSKAAPRAWVSASAVGFYGSRPGEVLTEDSRHGNGFLAAVTRRWEASARPAAQHTRLAYARTGIVLSADAALGPLITLARLGLAGRLGSGHQHWPWVSLRDEAAAYVHLATNSRLAGPANISAPRSSTSEEVTRTVAAALRRPHWLPAPAWALRTALGTAADDLLLADQNVMPERLTDEGFVFRDGDLVEAVRQAVAAGR